MTTTTRRWVAAGGLLVVALAWGIRGASAEPSTYVTASGAPTAESAEVQTHANAVYELFNGTMGQRNASGVLQAWALNGAMDTCMRERGFPAWDWSMTRNGAPRTNALGSSELFVAPLGHAYSNAMMDVSDSVRAEEHLRLDNLGEAENAAVGACLDATPPGSDEAAHQAAVPAGVDELRDAWASMLANLDERYGSADAQAACVFRAAEKSPVFDETAEVSWRIGLTRLLPDPADIPRDGTDPRAQKPVWQDFLSAEAAAEEADWRCRRDVYENHLADVDAAITDFAREHESEIEAAAGAWHGIESAAAELGYHGQTGSLD